MHIPMNQYQAFPQVVDICFYNCLNQVKNSSKCLMAFFIARVVIVLWYIIAHFKISNTDQTTVYDLVSVLLFVILGFNLATFTFAQWIYRNFLTNDRAMNQIAEKTQHNKIIEENNEEDLNSFYLPTENYSLKVSKKVYQFTNNIEITDIDDEYRQRVQRTCSAMISQQIDTNQWSKFWGQLFNLCSIGIFVYSIVILSKQGVDASEISFIVTYLFTEICTRIFIYLVLLIIGLSPLCCVGFCIYSCFIKKQRVVQLPATQQATLQVLQQCEGQCPICFMNLVQNQKIVILKCSPKHVFHQLCIKGWSKIGKTCPVCRAQI